MDRGAIISEAWSIMRSNRSLWGIAVLVLIASLITGIVAGLIDSVIVLIAGMIVGLLLTAFLSGALISMVNAIAADQPISVSAGFNAGVRWIVPLFMINLILTIPLWITTYFLSGSLTAALTGAGLGSIAQIQQAIARFGAAWILILLVSLLCSAIGVGAERTVVLRQRSGSEALKRGWQLLWVHLGDYVVIGLLLLVVSIGIGLLFACGMMATGFVFGTTRSSGYFSSSLTLSTIIIAILSSAANIVITVLQSAAWTLAFREWQAQERSELPVAVE